jgi:hypothetical protein
MLDKFTYNTKPFGVDKLIGCYPYLRTPKANSNFSPKNTTVKERAKQGLAMLTVFYSDMAYMPVREQAVWTYETLFGVLGGQLGLLSGFLF